MAGVQIREIRTWGPSQISKATPTEATNSLALFIEVIHFYRGLALADVWARLG